MLEYFITETLSIGNIEEKYTIVYDRLKGKLNAFEWWYKIIAAKDDLGCGGIGFVDKYNISKQVRLGKIIGFDKKRVEKEAKRILQNYIAVRKYEILRFNDFLRNLEKEV